MAKKKKAELGDQFAVYRQRLSPRFACSGGLSIDGYEGEGLLKNVCAAGCCLESVTYVTLTPGTAYRITVVPEAGIDLGPFQIEFLASWTRSSETRFEAGFCLDPAKTTGDPRMERYAELLKARGVEPEYGNMDPSGPQT